MLLLQAEYVQLVVKHLTHGRMGEQAACLRDGIGAVLHDPRGRLLGLYTAQVRRQLRLLMLHLLLRADAPSAVRG